jgi:hypothetical protein
VAVCAVFTRGGGPDCVRSPDAEVLVLEFLELVVDADVGGATRKTLGIEVCMIKVAVIVP